MNRYVSPPLSALHARLLNALCVRDWPWSFLVEEQPCILELGQADAPFATACCLYITMGDSLWRMDIGSLAPLRLLPALREEPGEAPYHDLPEALRLAVLESLFTPLAAQAAVWLNTTVGFTDAPADATDPAGEPSLWSGFVPLTLTLPFAGSDSSGSSGSSGSARDNADGVGELLPLRLFYADANAVAYVIDRLNELPVRLPDQSFLAALPVECGLETGALALSVAELRGLETGDVLLPDGWNPEEPRLRLPNGSVFVCRAAGANAEIVGALHNDAFPPLVEHIMTQDSMDQENSVQIAPSDEPRAQAGEPSGVAVDTLELTVRFELERLSFTVGELARLTPGYVFALGCDSSSPVTLRVGEVAVGAGRLVDINGTPGVQVTRLFPVPPVLAGTNVSGTDA